MSKFFTSQYNVVVMAYSSNKLNYFGLSPLIVLLWGVFSLLFRPVIPVASGYGWDGVFYGQVALDFPNMIGHVDGYHANRIFPGVLIHYFYKACNIPLNIESVLLGFRIYGVIILFCSSLLWVLIARRLLLTPLASWIGFCALFINYPLANLHFYYPALTDGTAFLLGMIMLYAYLLKNNILLIGATIVAFFSWPAAIIVGFILFIYLHAEGADEYFDERKTPLVVVLSILAPALFVYFYCEWRNFHYIVHDLSKYLILHTGLGEKLLGKFKERGVNDQVNWVNLFCATFNTTYIVVVYWLVLKNFNLTKLVFDSFRKSIFMRILICVLLLCILIVSKHFIYSSDLPSLSLFEYFTLHVFSGESARFPLEFIVYHISYYGPIIVFLILFFNKFIMQVKMLGLPIMLAFLYIVIFSINGEARPIIEFYPFIVVVVLQTIDFSKFKSPKVLVALFVITSLFYSKIWLPINLPSSVFPDSIWTGRDKFPMQWFFMNFGLWTNAEMYFVHLTIACITIIVFYLFIKLLSLPEKR